MTSTLAVLVATALAATGGWLVFPSRRVRPTSRAPDAGAVTRTIDDAGSWRLRAAAAAGAALAALVVLPGVTAVVGGTLVGVLVWRRSARWERAAERRRRERLADDLPHVVDLLAACLAAGAAPADALCRLVPLLDDPARAELAAWAERLRWGSDAVTVWADLARHPQLGRLGSTLRRSAESGAPVVEALDRLSDDLRSARRTEVEERVRRIEVRAAVPLGVCLLPAFLLLGVVPLVAGSAVRLLGG